MKLAYALMLGGFTALFVGALLNSWLTAAGALAAMLVGLWLQARIRGDR